jgi:hypothetical protein
MDGNRGLICVGNTVGMQRGKDLVPNWEGPKFGQVLLWTFLRKPLKAQILRLRVAAYS